LANWVLVVQLTTNPLCLLHGVRTHLTAANYVCSPHIKGNINLFNNNSRRFELKPMLSMRRHLRAKPHSVSVL